MGHISRYLNNIVARFNRQYDKGLAKYGQLLELSPASIPERLEHLAGELTDALNYIEWLKDAYAHSITFLPIDWQGLGLTQAIQLKKIGEEYGEVAEATLNDDPEEMMFELLDTMQACHTMILMVLYENPTYDFNYFMRQHNLKLLDRKYILNGGMVNEQP